MRELRASFRTVCLLISLLATAGGPAAAAELDTWYRYENQFFEAYSDAPEQRVRKLLQDLENFRAATVQLYGEATPDGSPRTRLIIFASSARFAATIDNDVVDAYTAGIDGTPNIVMTLGKAQDWARITVRHEFIHVMQGYSGKSLPTWYFEGNAEFMSGIRFRKKDTEFIIGGPPVRKKSEAALVDWDWLVSGNFSFQQLRSGAEVSNAYLQAALLVRHLTSGDATSNEGRLSAYLERYSTGTMPDSAFEEILGASASAMGPKLYKQRRKRRYARVHRFDRDARDHRFSRTAVESHTVDRMLEALATQRSTAPRNSEPKKTGR